MCTEEFHGQRWSSDSGELSIKVSKLPTILSPCLHPLPTELTDKQTRIRNRHVDFLVNPRMADIIRLRSEIVSYVRNFLQTDNQVEVQTPVLAEGAGGAIARSFETRATEFMDRKINLRIAPELWLKRMIIGGFDRVFEIGPSFRNEGLDLTHNPEFTTCEFYRAYTSLDELIGLTEEMLIGLACHVSEISSERLLHLKPAQTNFQAPFPRLDFIPALEKAMNMKLPDLKSPNAAEKVCGILTEHGVAILEGTSLPQMLDRLSAHFLEPQCQEPTFIINHPDCLSPLSKSFVHPDTNQLVAARAELFIDCKEIVNTYEEENSPVEQRRKFVEQLEYRDGPEDACVDESYIEALEWGLPPTGGWGCGIDRLCMLMAGTDRIGDVLSFGNLRNVVSLAHTSKIR
jgi:lysyl-tRNA synthetase class 2